MKLVKLKVKNERDKNILKVKLKGLKNDQKV